MTGSRVRLPLIQATGEHDDRFWSVKFIIGLDGPLADKEFY